MSHSSGPPPLSFTRSWVACSPSRHWMACSCRTEGTVRLHLLPLGDPKLLWSGGAAALLVVPYAFAYIERAALESPARTAALAATLAGIVLAIKIIDRAQRRERRQLDFDERPAPPTQRLGVFESMADSRLSTSLSFDVRLPPRSFDVRRRGQNVEADERRTFSGDPERTPAT